MTDAREERGDPPAKRLRLELTLDAHDRADLADKLRSLAAELERDRDYIKSISSMGWAWSLTVRSNLTCEQYEDALNEWAQRR